MSKDNNMVNTYKQQLMYLSQQKQQLQVQLNVLENTVKELESTKETKVYKGVGNIFILKDKADVITESKDTKDTVQLRLKTVEKQEADTLKRLNEMSKDSKSEGKDESNTEGIA